MSKKNFIGQIAAMLSNLHQIAQDEAAMVAKMAAQLEAVKDRGDTNKALAEMLTTVVELQQVRSQATLQVFECEAFLHIRDELEAFAIEEDIHVGGDEPEPLEAQGMPGMGVFGSVNEAE